MTCVHAFYVVVFEKDASQPVSVENGVMRFRIGSTAYIVDGYTVQIICNTTIFRGSEEHPITISWLRNGKPDQTRGNVSMITVADANHNDVFTCIANSTIISRSENTTIIFVHHRFCI